MPPAPPPARPVPAPRPVPEEERWLEPDLRRALARGGLALHYQPRVCLRTGRTLGAEALLRWAHHRRGPISPARFVPAAEQSGLIVELGAWALARACAEAAVWPGEVGVSVNVSAVQLAEGGLERAVRAALAESRLPPGRLELELTESVLVDAGIPTLLTLSALRDLGVRLALDDFGTGHASLSTLRRLPLTVLKLDRSLVRGIPREAEEVAVARAVVGVGRALGLTVVAEGVETHRGAAALLEMGCDEAQAFLFGRPGPPEAMRERLLAEALPPPLARRA